MIFTPKINTANIVDLTLYGVSVCIAANIGPTQNVTFTDIKNKVKNRNLICVAPDVGGTERARALGKILNVGF